VREAIEEQEYVDGLQHFVQKGFAQYGSGVWLPENLKLS